MALLLIHIKISKSRRGLFKIASSVPAASEVVSSLCLFLWTVAPQNIPRVPCSSSTVSSFISSTPEDCLKLTIHFSPLFMKFRQYGPGKACEHENGVDGSRDLDGHVCEYFGPKYT